jgi:hypothetical protein
MPDVGNMISDRFSALPGFSFAFQFDADRIIERYAVDDGKVKSWHREPPLIEMLYPRSVPKYFCAMQS